LRSWSAESSAAAEKWSPENPAWGQCAVTALIVQDTFGGEILRTTAQLPGGGTYSHYLNRLKDGQLLDLTSCQFPPGTTFGEATPKTTPENPTTRDYILSHENTRMRYWLLKSALAAQQKPIELGTT